MYNLTNIVTELPINPEIIIKLQITVRFFDLISTKFKYYLKLCLVQPQRCSYSLVFANNKSI